MHWDRLIRKYGWPRAKLYFIGQITKYIERHEKKNGIKDLEKGLHFYQKLLEEEKKHLSKQIVTFQPKEVDKELHTWKISVEMEDVTEQTQETNVGPVIITPEQAKEWWHPYSSPEEALGAMGKGLHPILQRVTCSENPYEVIAKEQEDDRLKYPATIFVVCKACLGSGKHLDDEYRPDGSKTGMKMDWETGQSCKVCNGKGLVPKSNEDFEARVSLPPREKGNVNVESTKE